MHQYKFKDLFHILDINVAYLSTYENGAIDWFFRNMTLVPYSPHYGSYLQGFRLCLHDSTT